MLFDVSNFVLIKKVYFVIIIAYFISSKSLPQNAYIYGTMIATD